MQVTLKGKSDEGIRIPKKYAGWYFICSVMQTDKPDEFSIVLSDKKK